jgi:hypothetical protein
MKQKGGRMGGIALLTSFLLMCPILMAGAVLPSLGRQAPSGTISTADREVYAGEAVGRYLMGDFIEGDLTDKPTSFTLEVTGYTTAQEAERYAEILKSRGQEGLMQAISMRNLGYFQLSGQPERAVIFAQRSQDGTGRTIKVLCERWLNTFVEGFEQRAPEFPFAFIQLSVDTSGKGEGTMYAAASIKFDAQTGNIEGATCYPARTNAARVDVANNTGLSIGVEDYANNRDWLREVQLKGAAPIQVQR